MEGDSETEVDGLLHLVKRSQLTDSRRSYQLIKILVNAANRSPAVKDILLQNPDSWEWAVNWLRNKMTVLPSAANLSGGSASGRTTGTTDAKYPTTIAPASPRTALPLNHPTTGVAVATTPAGRGGAGPTSTTPPRPLPASLANQGSWSGSPGRPRNTQGSFGFGRRRSSSSTTELSNEDVSTRTFQRTTSAQVILEEADALLAAHVDPYSESREAPRLHNRIMVPAVVPEATAGARGTTDPQDDEMADEGVAVPDAMVSDDEVLLPELDS